MAPSSSVHALSFLSTEKDTRRKRRCGFSIRVAICYGSTGPSGYRDSRTSRVTGFEGSGVLGRVGPSVNSGASMSVVEVQGF